MLTHLNLAEHLSDGVFLSLGLGGGAAGTHLFALADNIHEGLVLVFVVALYELGEGGEGVPAAVLLNADLAHCILAELFLIDEFPLDADAPEEEDRQNGDNDNSCHFTLF